MIWSTIYINNFLTYSMADSQKIGDKKFFWVGLHKEHKGCQYTCDY